MSPLTLANHRIATSTLCQVSDIDDAFLRQVLKPYRPSCQYLKRVHVGFETECTRTWDSIVAIGEFEIDRSCYIDDTGHFNAVEFNICYNQLAYVLLATCVRESLLPALDDYTLDGFFKKQLSNYLIASIQSHYHSELNPRDFVGEVRLLSARRRSRLSILKTACRFQDQQQGRSDGEVKLVVLGA
ncbi:FcoT family thioesterase [Rhodopirellula sp. MGV]|uniref:FcoT family thioesterase n=1 Tax=Rhodopirellula sp. MGV TaxID=2023130 RepID=UPI000B96B1A0|nr:FcoT family thioesterase [Rhodopirellula sp. MGV]OYP36085.1 hypothetical protein CGZ80_10090 [Rhodopirellula sp. MGV]PNY36558.1 hypothetical protein C2E31_11920 [Rhodopirellula baltica]